MLVWCLNQVKDCIFEFSRRGRFFSEKEFSNLYTIIFASFRLDGCVDDDGDNWKNYQGYKYVYFLQYHTFTFIHSLNGEVVYYIFRKTITLNALIKNQKITGSFTLDPHVINRWWYFMGYLMGLWWIIFK